MRLWTLHPCYLDPAGLVALWREALLAQRVLAGGTRGYRHHPQLQRFRAAPDPLGAIASYLEAVQREATARGYRFDAGRIAAGRHGSQIDETAGQLHFEALHLRRKLEARTPALAPLLDREPQPRAHPLFRIVDGPVRDWERAADRPLAAPGA